MRDTVADEAGLSGRGINVQDDPDTGTASEVTVLRSLVAGNQELGVFAEGSTVTLDEVVVRDTLADATGLGGRGISAQENPDTGTASDVTVRRSLDGREPNSRHHPGRFDGDA